METVTTDCVELHQETPATAIKILFVMGNFCAYFLGFFLPPDPVAMKRGCGADVLINLGLCALGWLPGVIRAYYIISDAKETDSHV